VHPKIEDSRCDHDLLGRRQQEVDRIEDRTACVGNPQGGEAEVVQLGSGLGGFVGIGLPQLGTPYANARQIQVVILYIHRPPHATGGRNQGMSPAGGGSSACAGLRPVGDTVEDRPRTAALMK
jgi:hypothetical protein